MLVRYELQKITWSQDQKQQTQLRGTTFSKFSDEVAPIEGTKTVVADLPHCSESTKESTRALCRAGDFGIDTLAGLLAEITECPTWRKNTEVEVLLNVDLIADKAKKKNKKTWGRCNTGRCGRTSTEYSYYDSSISRTMAVVH